MTKSQNHTEDNARETETCRWSSFRTGEKKKKRNKCRDTSDYSDEQTDY